MVSQCLVIDMGGNEVVGLGDPSADSSATNKKYVDATSGILQAQADATYLKKTDATTTYETRTSASNTYLSKTRNILHLRQEGFPRLVSQ